MSTDLELLELAAKAAGYSEDQVYPGHSGGLTLFEEDESTCGDGTQWNPLEDDGDALRLAVKLHIDLELNNGSATGIWIDLDRSETHTVEEACDEEFQGWRAKEAATRRAIVRAAAEIGKSLP